MAQPGGLTLAFALHLVLCSTVALLDLIICLDILPRTKNACKTAEMKMKQETALIIIVLVGLKIIIINVFL